MARVPDPSATGSGWDTAPDAPAAGFPAVAPGRAALSQTRRPGLRPLDPAAVRLRPSAIQRRWQRNREYLVELTTDNLLRNHRFEAGVWGASERPEDIHWGWESPTSVLRGHFLGHWMSAAAHVVRATGDPELRGKLDAVVAELGHLQQVNGGQWVYPIPPRDLEKILRGPILTYATSYVMEKTLTGLFEAYVHTGNEAAFGVVLRAGEHLHRWTGARTDAELAAVTSCFIGNMSELWADVFAITGREEHLDLLKRYERTVFAERLLAGTDVLTNRHANDSIPLAHGAARAYEVTGDRRYRDIVEAFWQQAVTDRGHYCTGGQSHGEVWTPPHDLASRLGAKNQELCTVYNMRRLAEYLWRWTSDPTYADYRERNLWNGSMAQQHPATGMCTYFLPLAPGSRKTWGSRLHDFWCCYGTMVQEHAQHGWDMLYEDDDGLVISELLPASATWERRGVTVDIEITDEPPRNPHLHEFLDPSAPVGAGRPDHTYHRIEVQVHGPASRFSLKVRVPWWAERAELCVDRERFACAPSSLQVVDRSWQHSVVEVRFWRTIRAEPLDGDPSRVAFVDGPVVLAGLIDHEVELPLDLCEVAAAFTPDEERAWSEWSGRHRLAAPGRPIRFMPLHAVTDETYTVYFPLTSS